MPRVLDVSKQPMAVWRLNGCQAQRELKKGFIVPISVLVPGPPKKLPIYVKLPGGPRCSPEQRLLTSVLAAQWWAVEGRPRWKVSKPQTYRVGRLQVRHGAKHRRAAAHGWGRACTVGAAQISSEQMRAIERWDVY
jgi:hypothetical protein